MVETCSQHRGKQYLHPIIDWSSDEVWEYIHKYNVPYCSLYDEGFNRLGCVMCPYGGQKHMMAEAERWPKIAKCYELAFQRMIDKRRIDDPDHKFKINWNTGAEVMAWWMGQDSRHTDDDGSISLFGLRLDESDV